MSRTLRQLRLPFEAAPAPADPVRLRHLCVGAEVFRYSLSRARRRTIALLVGAAGIEVRAPRHATIADIESFIRDKEDWIRKRLAEPRARPFLWQAGAILPWLGGSLTVALRPDGGGVVARTGQFLEIGLAEPDADARGLRERALAWIRGQAIALFRERVAAMSERLGLGAAAIGLSDALTQWGSCSARGRVLLNWRLMMLPPHLIDYVVAHELAHRRELNHSKRFWAIVASVYPDCAAARQELNRLAKSLPEL